MRRRTTIPHTRSAPTAASEVSPAFRVRRRPPGGPYTDLVNAFTSEFDGAARALTRGAVVITILSVLETLTFALLLVAMAANSDIGVSVVGLVHGLLFAGFMLAVLNWRAELRWSPRFAAVILTGPVGPVLALERLRRVRFGRHAPRR